MAQNESERLDSLNEIDRREFLARALSAASVIAIAGMEAAAPPPACPPDGAVELPEIGKLQSKKNKLTGIIKVKNQERNAGKGGAPAQVRYFAGYDEDGKQVWPPGGDNNKTPVPGPTLEASVGDTVQLTFLNQVDVSKFQGSLDRSEEGRDNGCDQVNKTNAQLIVDVKNWYPADDKFPNCLHGSSTANIHFHGTHTTPDQMGDNVLLQIRPLSPMTPAAEKKIQSQFKKIFDNYDKGVRAKTWAELDSPWTIDQEKALKNYDKTAPYQGRHGLPPDQRLWPQDEAANEAKIWPQWYIGSFPYTFTLPKHPGNNPEYPPDPRHPHDTVPMRMGQAAGTHWYHAHKHGSTSINLFNGMSGAFIIRSDYYDGKLNAFYEKDSQGSPRLKEKLLFVQQITPIPNLMSSAGGGIPVYVNGQSNKTTKITMQPGEVQLWRIVNATAGGGQGTITLQFTPVTSGAAAVAFKQIAQDGVQFHWDNFNNKQNGQQPIAMASANRVDLLVQAPSQAGCYTFGTLPQGQGAILTLVVAGNAVNPPMGFPQTKADFPELPHFLDDIKPETIRLRRELNYGWGGPMPGNTGPGRDAKTGAAPKYMIDGKQFQDQIIDQAMLLDSAEEWTILNTTLGIAHPFHIHINPFQVIEVFDPSTMEKPLQLKPPFVWWDTFAIPAGVNKTDSTGKQVFVPGYFKMRSRFVDFTGTYVNHCHILAHEDRGMMQLVQVVSNRTVLKHH